jgi:hypothetical protein
MNSTIITNYALPSRYLRDGKWRWRGMTLYFKDFFHPLTTWIFNGSIVLLHLFRLIAFQYCLDNLSIAVNIRTEV